MDPQLDDDEPLLRDTTRAFAWKKIGPRVAEFFATYVTHRPLARVVEQPGLQPPF